MEGDKAHLAVDERRLWAALCDLAAIGATPAGGVCRLALSEEELGARRLLAGWAREGGWTLSVDPIGNLFIRREGLDSNAAPVITGSHIDTQPTGGRFDGAYGVMAGIEVLRAFDDAKIRTRRPIEVAVWMNEEGSRFSPGMMGSEAFAGVRSLQEMMAVTDAHGVTVADALKPVFAATPQASRRPAGFPVHAFVEAHIEQGAELESADKTIGVVTGIQGTCRFRVEIHGEEAHPGTTRRRQRRDALLAATQMIQAIERHIEERDPDDDVRLTFGMLQVHPNVPSVVASRAKFSIDLRHFRDDVLMGLAEEVGPLCHMNARGCKVSISEIQRALATSFKGVAIEAVRKATERLGYRHMEMPSGAGHDSRQLARVCPTAMIFVPCKSGISHNEAEDAKPEDLAAGARVLAAALLDLARS